MIPLKLRIDESVCEVDALLCVVFHWISSMGIGGAEGLGALRIAEGIGASVFVCDDDVALVFVCDAVVAVDDCVLNLEPCVGLRTESSIV